MKGGRAQMEQSVYGDLLFLINFSMDFLCLFLVAQLTSRYFSMLRGAMAAALGGIYAVATLFISFGGYFDIILHLLICFAMCWITFFRKGESLRAMAILTAALLLASLLLGGIMTAIFHLLNRASPPDSLIDTHQMPLWLFATIALLSSVTTWIGGRFLRARAQIEYADVEIRLGNRRAIIRAMCDNGNLLRDAISGKPVIVADSRHAVNLLPANLPPIESWNLQALSSLPPSLASRLRIIPQGSAGYEGMLLALRPDNIMIHTKDISRTADAFIGFTDIKNAPDGISAIIPPELIT